MFGILRSCGVYALRRTNVKLDVYCDESRPDLFAAKNPRSQYLVIGSLWLPAEARDGAKAALHKLRDKHRIGGEFKWQKVSPSKLAFYRELMEWFVSSSDLRFRCIAVDREKVNLPAFHDSDQELGFYKLYYQVLLHWIEPGNEYNVFCDFKRNRVRARLGDLKRCLQCKSANSRIGTIQSVRSEESVLVQLVDVLTGLASAKLNWALRPGSAKAHVLDSLEAGLHRPIQPTGRRENKFNVFMIELREGE